MCIPLAAAAAAVSVASAGAQYLGQRQQAKQQARYQAQASAAERQRALREQQSIRMRQGQERVARGKERQRIHIKLRKKLGTEGADIANRGVTGLSREAAVNDLVQQEAEYSASLQQQGEMSDLQTGLALTDAGFGSQNRLIGINRYVPSTSLGAGLASIASAGLQGALTGHQINSAMGGGGRGLDIPKGSSYLPASDQYTDPTY